MPQIGTFSITLSGYTGTLKTLSLDLALALVRAEQSDAENAPAYRIHLGAEGDGPEVGAAWHRIGERAGAYLSLVLDDPAIAQPIHANLFRTNHDSGTHRLVWTRPVHREADA